MIGEGYFQTRASLLEALSALDQLARETGAGPEFQRPLQDLRSGMQDPFQFVAIGDAKAGKSSFLNAVFGADFCRVDPKPASDSVHVFKHAEVARDVVISKLINECHRPHEFLRNFIVVDTTGTRSILSALEEAYFPRADLVFVVFAITSPWAASTLELLQAMRKEWLNKVVLIVQQSDLREPVEIAAVVKHLDRTVRERCGTKFPIFAFSGFNALEARKGSPAAAQLMDSSNLPQLENYIADVVMGSPQRTDKLRSVCQSCRRALADLAERSGSVLNLVINDHERLAQLGPQREQRKSQSLNQAVGLLQAFANAYETAQQQAEELFRAKLSPGQTFKLISHRAGWQRDFGAELEAKLQPGSREEIENAAVLLEDDLKSSWGQLHELIQDQFLAVNAPQGAMPDFTNRRSELLRRIKQSLLHKMSGDVDQQVQRLFSETLGILHGQRGAPASSTQPPGGAALATAAMADVATSIASLAAELGTVTAIVEREKVLERFKSEMTRRRGHVIAAIETRLRNSVEQFYQELDRMLEPLRTFCASQRKIYEPIRSRLNTQDENLARIAARLGT